MNRDYSEKMPLVLTAKEMAELDRQTIEEIGIPGIVLMEAAGRRVVVEVVDLLGDVRDKRVVIFCGKGNNGGDGYVVARHLHKLGAHVETFLIGEHDDVKGDARTNLNILKNIGIDVLPWSHEEHAFVAKGGHLVVDALLGTGVKGALRGDYEAVVAQINASGARVVAIDLPTGVETDTGAVHGACVQADVTVTMGHLKRGLLFSSGREHAGRIAVADIGIPRVVSEKSDARCYQTSEAYVRDVLPRRAGNTFKNRCGQVIVLAGSAGLTGAAALSSEAVLRAGAGMALLGVPKSLNPILEEKLSEVMTVPLPETEMQSIGWEAKSAIKDRLGWADVVAVGPGLSIHEDSLKLVKWLLESWEKAIVLDADALNCLADHTDLLKKAKGQPIITPHPGELSRLIKRGTKEIVANPVDVAREAAAQLNAVLILKGGPTVVASPDGEVFINSTGNPGMATAGMGDVLTGVVAGLAAQGLSPLDAAITGVFIHGRAGDLARATYGQFGMIAGDVLHHLPATLKTLEPAD